MKQYLIKKGDTLSKIALTQLRTSSLWPEIAKANNIRYPYTIFEGMRVVIPTEVLDRRDRVSVHAPVQKFHLQDHVSVHPSVQSIGVSSAVQTAYAGSGAPAVMCPQLKMPDIDIVWTSVGYPNADITAEIKGEITLQYKGSIVELQLEVAKKQPFAPFNIKSSKLSFFNSQGEFTGNDRASMKIKSEYSSKILDLVGTPSINYDPLTKTASVSCGLAVAAKVQGKVFMTGELYVDVATKTIKYTASSGELNKIPSGKYEVSANVKFECVIKYKTGSPESVRSVPLPVQIKLLADKWRLDEKETPGGAFLAFAWLLRFLSAEGGWVLGLGVVP